MAKPRAKHNGGENSKTLTINYDVESISNMALKVKAEGFVPTEDLKAEFGPEKFTRGIAVLYRDFHMFREVRRPWKDGTDVLGYEWADRRFSKAAEKKIPPQLGFLPELTSKTAPKYRDFQRVTAKCRYLTAVLGGCPVKNGQNEPVNSFERDEAGNIQILRYNQRAMISRVLPMIGKEQALARHMAFSTIRLHGNGNLSRVSRPVNDNGQGKGFCISERLPDGTEFTISAMIPTSILSVAEYLEALRLAGEMVGLSPGRSAGFGDFEVLEAE